MSKVIAWLGALILATSGLFINAELNDPFCNTAKELVMDDKYNNLLSEEQKKSITVMASKKIIECFKKDEENSK